jgi:hypothetical protein
MPPSTLDIRHSQFERAGVRCFLLLALLTQLSTLNPQLCVAATFTNSITISEGNAVYDGQDIVIDRATEAIDGPHAFNSLLPPTVRRCPNHQFSAFSQLL